MKRVAANTAFWMVVLGISSYYLFFLVLGFDIMTEVASGLVLGAACVVSYRWFWPALDAVRTGAKQGYELLNLGIFFLSMALIYQRIWVNVTRWLDRPDWLITSSLGPLAAWSIFWGLAVVIFAPDTAGAGIPNRNYLMLGIACACGSLFAGITIGLQLARILGV